MSEDVKTKLAEARKAKEAREAAKSAQAAERELALLDLEAKFEAELGPRGKEFEIVDTVDGPIVLKRGESVLHKAFQNSKVDDAAVAEYVMPCVVHPTRDKYAAIVDQRPGIAYRCANALATLFGAKDVDDAGKF